MRAWQNPEELSGVKYDRPIHELLRECADDLREPFGATDVLRWFEARYPDVAASAVRAHIQAMTGNVPNRQENYPYLGSRPPALRRLSRGLYARWTGSALGHGGTGLPEQPVQTPVRETPDAVDQVISLPDTTEEWFWEGTIQASLIAHLVREGYQLLRVADTDSREAGTDVIARRAGRTLHVEVKGWPSQFYRDPAKAHLKKRTSAAVMARSWFNDAVVHALRLRDAHPSDDVAICLPDKATYRNLLAGVARSVAACSVEVLVVDERGAVQSASPRT